MKHRKKETDLKIRFDFHKGNVCEDNDPNGDDATSFICI